MNYIYDHLRLSPTPEQWLKVSKQMLKYVNHNSEHNILAEQTN